MRRGVMAVGFSLMVAACVPSQPGPQVQSFGPVQVSVDGTAYPVRAVAGEVYMMAHVSPLTPSDLRGPAIRVGGTTDGTLAAHVLNAYCTGAEGYTVAGAADAVLYGAFGDFFWQDPATGEWVFPMENCRA